MQRIMGPQLSPWLVIPIGLVVTSVIGYLDYVTGDYSLLIFYLIPVASASWLGGKGEGCFLALAAGTARVLADSAATGPLTRLECWNWGQEIVFFLMVGVLVNVLRHALERE